MNKRSGCSFFLSLPAVSQDTAAAARLPAGPDSEGMSWILTAAAEEAAQKLTHF